MELILLQDVENLGEKFQTVKVKPGYGRNYLLPRRMAVVANQSNKNAMSSLIKQLDKKRSKEMEEWKATAARLQNTPLSVGAKVGASNKIFGSVTNVQLAEAIKRLTGVEVDRRKIHINEEVKTLGTYSAHVELHKEVKIDVNFDVVSE